MRVIVLLLLINAIKIPPGDVPILYVENMDASAFATPWLIVIRDKSRVVLDHEHCHIEQMNIYGSIWFFVINSYYLYKYGYMDNPIEKNCYLLEG